MNRCLSTLRRNKRRPPARGVRTPCSSNARSAAALRAPPRHLAALRARSPHPLVPAMARDTRWADSPAARRPSSRRARATAPPLPAPACCCAAPRRPSSRLLPSGERASAAPRCGGRRARSSRPRAWWWRSTYLVRTPAVCRPRSPRFTLPPSPYRAPGCPRSSSSCTTWHFVVGAPRRPATYLWPRAPVPPNGRGAEAHAGARQAHLCFCGIVLPLFTAVCAATPLGNHT